MDFKRTKNRIKILNVLNYTSTPLCAEDVYTMLNKEINIATIYRNLNFLSDKKFLLSLYLMMVKCITNLIIKATLII